MGRIAPLDPQTGVAIDRYLRMRRTHLLADTSALWLGDRGKGLEYYCRCTLDRDWSPPLWFRT